VAWQGARMMGRGMRHPLRHAGLLTAAPGPARGPCPAPRPLPPPAASLPLAPDPRARRLQVLACLAYNTPAVQGSRGLFLALTCVFLACMGGNFAMFPTACANTFGARDGAAIYAVLFSAFGIASIAAVSLTKELQRVVGWTGVFRLFAGMSAAAAALSFFYKPLPPRPVRR